MAAFRPGKNDKNRFIFNWAHRIVGISAFVISRKFVWGGGGGEFSLNLTTWLFNLIFIIVSKDATIFLGVFYYIKNDVGWYLMIFWISWLLVLVLIIEVNIRRGGNTEEYYSFDTAQYVLSNLQCSKKTKVYSKSCLFYFE